MTYKERDRQTNRKNRILINTKTETNRHTKDKQKFCAIAKLQDFNKRRRHYILKTVRQNKSKQTKSKSKQTKQTKIRGYFWLNWYNLTKMSCLICMVYSPYTNGQYFFDILYMY